MEACVLSVSYTLDLYMKCRFIFVRKELNISRNFWGSTSLIYTEGDSVMGT